MNKETIFSVPDIVCDGCVSSIKNALGKLEGVGQIDIDVERKIVSVEHGEDLTRAQIEEKLDDIGFSVG